MRTTSFICTAALLPIALVALTSCGGETPPKTLNEIFAEEQKLPTLYLTAITGKRVLVPGRLERFTDPETGEVCWPALVCVNPDCPVKKQTGEPHIFISPDIGFVAKPDGTAVPGTPDPRTVKGTSNQCPQCLKVRNRNTESKELKQNYINWVKTYVPPETEAKMKELADERRKRFEYDDNAK